MDTAEFTRRFRDDQEIGRDATDTHLLVFYDNGVDVGLWRQHRGTTEGTFEVLTADNAELARYWYSQGDRELAKQDAKGWRAKTAAPGRPSLPDR